MLTVIIKTKNSEETIPEVLESVKDLGEIVVLDEHSNDDTILLAKEYKAQVVYTSTLELVYTFQQTLNEAKNDWILFLEGNEIIPDKLGQKILNYIETPKKNKNVVFLPQKLFYLEKEIKADRKLKLKLFKKGYAELLNNYSTDLKPLKTKKQKINLGFRDDKNCILKFEKRDIFTMFQDAIEKNIIKSKENNKKSVSLFIKPFFNFFSLYFIKGAFLEGKKGFVYSVFKAIDCFILQCGNFERNIR